MLLHDKVIIITGAGGGLGEGIARVCHGEGASVVIADVRGGGSQRPRRARSGVHVRRTKG